MFLQGQCLVFASECMLVLVARRDQQHNLWEQGSLSAQDRQATLAVSCKHAQDFSKKMFRANVIWMLSKCCLNVVSGDNIQTTLAASCKHIQDCPQKFFLANVVLSECCLNVVSGDNIQTTLGGSCKHIQDFPQKKFLENVVWMLSLETTLRQHSGKRIVFRLFLARNKCFWPLKKVKNTYVVRMLSLETTLRQHSGKRSVFRLFLARHKCFRPLKKVKNTYFVRMLSLETTFRQHSLICCELQTCPVFLSTRCVLCQCCLNVVSRGGI